ncbi:MAG: ATP-binding protein [Thermoplasmata archaeon]|nr:ATP-binding protein [Thermoplasmata archaeon]
MLEDSIRKWNPWWVDINELSDLIGEKRAIIENIQQTFSIRHIKDIIGIRRSGKTTTLYQIIDLLIENKIKPKKIVFLNFDDPDIQLSSFDDLIKAIDKINPDVSHIFLDEIQQKKNWESWLRTLYDNKKYKQIFISGSSSSLLTQDVGRVLSGRHVTFRIFPFSFKEYLKFIGWNDFSEDYLEHNKNKLLHYLKLYIEGGGFPETINKNEYQRKIILTNLYNDILARDIASRYNASFEIAHKICYHLMSNNGKEFSFRSVANGTNLSVETVDKYIEYLKESFILFTLNVFSYKTKVQFKQNKKVYSIDTGLRNAVSFKISEDIGRLAENIVFTELKRRNQEFYYWKNNKVEVDFVIKEGLKPTDCIQVCWDITNKKTKKREIESLVIGLETFKLGQGTIITEDIRSEEIVKEKKIEFIPLWKWLLGA